MEVTVGSRTEESARVERASSEIAAAVHARSCSASTFGNLTLDGAAMLGHHVIPLATRTSFLERIALRRAGRNRRSPDRRSTDAKRRSVQKASIFFPLRASASGGRPRNDRSPRAYGPMDCTSPDAASEWSDAATDVGRAKLRPGAALHVRPVTAFGSCDWARSCGCGA
jgi:hypothetical protein